MTDGAVDKPKLGLRRFIERPRLTRLLDESPARIKMLVAPAGYGKTTLARQWLKGHDRHGWFGLTPAASDPAVLISQLAGIAAMIAPDSDLRVKERLRFTTNPESEWHLLIDMLIEDLALIDPAAWIGIDDHQVLPSSHLGEAIVEAFVANVPFGVMLVSRSRPTWVTTRMLLYGEITELGRNDLAMTSDEATEAFGADTAFMPGLVHLCDGWPAVLAIAALHQSENGFPEELDVLPKNLYEFFADELYSGLDPATARGLAGLALAGVDDADVIRDLGGGDDILARGLAAGWLTSDVGGPVEFQPLLRSFLLAKLEADDPSEFRNLCHVVGETLIRHQFWDATYRLILSHSVDALAAVLVESAWQEMCQAGRVSTLREWLRLAVISGASSPQIALATAEMSFRSGRFYESEVAAADVARSHRAHSVHAEALIAAGRAAHAGSREERALEYFRQGREAALSLSDRSAATLGELSAAIDLELPETVMLLDELRGEASSHSLEHRTILVGRAIAVAARFGLPPDLDEGRNAYQLLSALPDPIARTSFRNVFAYALAMAGLTTEATSVLDDQRVDVQTYRIDFAHAHTDAIGALIALFEGRFADCEQALNRIEVEAHRRSDAFLLANVVSLRTRLLVSSGEFNAAIVAAVQFVGASTVSMQGEINASHAVALACAGHTTDATEVSSRAAAMTRSSEIVVMVECVRAIVAIQEGEAEAFKAASSALNIAQGLGVLESFVTALRGFPELGAILLGSPETRQRLVPVLTACNELARYESIELKSNTIGGWGDLSPREREVLQLVALGLSNREIATRLFIAETTAKVHVHKILVKLGVPSRTAAAMRVPPSARLTQPE